MKSYLTLLLVFFFVDCAVLYQHHLGDIDNTVKNKKPFTIIVSHLGIAIGDVALSAEVVGRTNHWSNANLRQFQIIKDIIEISNMGPRTGLRVFSDTYMDKIMDEIYKKCPSGMITDLSSTREMARYPMISGEIAKITGNCIETQK